MFSYKTIQYFAICYFVYVLSLFLCTIQGVRPESFDKIVDPKIKKIIDGCTKTRREERYTVKDLLQDDFFQEEVGIRVEVVHSDQDADKLAKNLIQLQLRILDPKKRKTQHKENEAIQFDYDMEGDNPDHVAQEMVGGAHHNTVESHCNN